MRRSFFCFFFILSILSCSDNNTDPVLDQPAYKSISDSIRSNGKDPELYYRRALLLYDNLEKKYAEDDLRKAWSMKPKESYALSLTTILRERSDKEATEFLGEAAIKLPESIAVRIGLARGYQKQSKYTEALAICDNIISVYPNQLDALLLKAELLDAENKTGEALKTLGIAYSYAPGDAELAHNYAFALAEAKDPKALVLSDSLIHSDSAGRHAEPFYFKGLYYENTGDFATAMKLFEDAIRHDYYFLDAHMEKGQLQYNLKKYKEALKTFTLAATISPTFADTYFWIAKSFEALGNKADAKINYQRAYGLDKTMTEAREAAARL
jgi:tetratricopeptide (TPR) repeat protein